jgi:chemotaxis protein methyltransferase CheR
MTTDAIATILPSDEATSFRAVGLSRYEFNALRALIYQETGISLHDGKKEMVCSRLTKRLRRLGLPSFGAYYDYLIECDPAGEERREMINCITTNKTDFFRERHHFDILRAVVFPQLQRRALAGGPRRLRIWSAACSTGEEPYTLAMMVREHFGPLGGWDIRILASDIDTEVLRRAEAGVYDEDRISDVGVSFKQKYFGKGAGAGKICVRPELRELIAFRRINLIEDAWPIRTRFDLIFCRNVIIYFDRPTQDRLLRRLAEHLTGDRYLFLGHSENIHWLTDLFTPLGNTVYQMRAASADLPTRATPALLPASVPPRAPVVEEKVIMAGQVFASDKPARVSTVLGSCVAACLFDPIAGVGGMNHFMLPDGSEPALPARYGVHAMELLINEIMKRGGDRRRLQAKLFGGAQVVNGGSSILNVGQRNVAFAKEFLGMEGIPIVSKCLGGTVGLKVRLFTHTGKVLAKPVDGSLLTEIAVEEGRYRRDILKQLVQPDSNNITLF